MRNAGSINGKSAVTLVIFKQPGANVIQTVDRIKALLPVLKASLPGDTDLIITGDRTTTIRASLADTEQTLIIAVLLVILVVFLFLREPRAMLIPGVMVPISIIGTFAAMYLLGYSLNNFSLMALTIATGFVVDDAVVVLENITRHLELGRSRLQAALDGTKEVAFTLYDAFGERQVSTIYNAMNQYAVVMEVAPHYWQNPATLKQLYVSTAGQIASGTQTSNAVAGTISSSSIASANPGSSAATVKISANNSAVNQAINSIAAIGRSSASSGAAVSTQAEAMVPLAAFTHYEFDHAPLSVNHQGLFVASTISFNLEPQYSLSDAVSAIRRTVDEIRMPATIHGTFAGTANVEDELASLRILGQQIGLNQAAVQAAQQAVDIALNEYQAGTVAYTTVLTAQVALLTDQETALLVQENRLIASVALVQALGGGWGTFQLPSQHQLQKLHLIPD